MHPYIPHTPDDIRQMLSTVGMTSLDDLYADVPSEFIYKGDYDLPDAMSEDEIRHHFETLAERNAKMTCFAGQGWYDHCTPSVIPYLTQRSEFLTAYTPYQPEISQGTLRYIFEYQSMICALTGLEVSNASMYDGPTAAAEAMRMAVASTRKRDTVLISSTLLPQVKEVVRTYASYAGIKVEEIEAVNGQTSLDALQAALSNGRVAGTMVPTTNCLGVIEDHTGFADATHAAGALFIEYCDPSTLAVLKSPAEWGADVAIGDGQSLGVPLCYGGPTLGFMACKKDYLRKLPGRIVGATTDRDGKRCFVLTLQAREQHIRRDKATSNICSNQSLMALWVTIYLSLLGPKGLAEVNERSCASAHYLCKELLATGLFTVVSDKPFLKEFALDYKGDARVLHRAIAAKGILAGVVVSEHRICFAVTEKRTREEIDCLIKEIKEAAL